MGHERVARLPDRRERDADAGLRLQTLEEFVQRPAISYLVGGLVPARSIVVVFGPPKQGKTFAVCDLTMHAAHGIDWQGFKMPRSTRVAYMAGEGTNGLRVRLRAWIEHHDSVEQAGEFRLLPETVSLPLDVRSVITAFEGFAPEIVVVDTLNAYYGGGDENATKDMSAFCNAIRMLRDEIGCAVVVIHHTGHGDQSRERGSIVLRASADVLIQVAKDEGGSGNVGFQVIAARDMETMSEPLALKLKQVDTSWTDDNGQRLSTCIVEGADGPVALAGRSKPLGVAQAAVLEVARRLARDVVPDASGLVLLARSDISAVARERGVKKQSVASAWQALADRGLLQLVEPGSVRLKVQP